MNISDNIFLFFQLHLQISTVNMSFDYDFDSYEVLVPEEDVDFVGFEDVLVPVVEQLQEVVPDVGDLEGDDVSGVLCDGLPVVQGSLMAICRAFGIRRLVRMIYFFLFFLFFFI